MRKEEFFKRLEYLLQDMPEQDKEEALQYYRDYLEEAGPEREEKVIGEFGSPERVAAIIRADLMGNLEDGGSFTETGYEDERFRDPNYQVAKRYDLPEKKEPERQESHTEYREKKVHETYRHVKQERWTSKPLKIVLLAVLLILASPFLLGIVGILFGILAGVLSLLFGIIITVVCLTGVAFLIAVILAVCGTVFMFASPLEGLLLIGGGAVSLGCGLIGLAMTVAFIGMFLPFLWRCLVKLAGSFSGRGKEKKHE